MRFGIALPGSGPLADDFTVGVTARAAEELDYASVWSTSVRQLLVVAAHAETLPVGLLIPHSPRDSPGGDPSESDPSESEPSERDPSGGDPSDRCGGGSTFDGVGVAEAEPDCGRDTAALARLVGSRLLYVGALSPLHGTIRSLLPGAVLLDTSDRPPSLGALSGLGAVDGWCPSIAAVATVPPDWRRAGTWPLLIVRIAGADSVPMEHLRDAMRAGADEVVVAFAADRTLDEQLAGFAEAAERVAALHERG